MAERSQLSFIADEPLDETYDADDPISSEIGQWEKASDIDIDNFELGIEEVEQKAYNIRCRIEAKVIVTGKSTGNTYVFPRAGSVVEVAEADVADLLAKRLGGKSCCGGGNPDGNVMFESA